MSNVLLDHFGRVAGNTSGSKFLIISVIRSYLEHWVQRVIMAHLLYLHQSFVCYLLYDKRMILLLLVYSYVAKNLLFHLFIYLTGLYYIKRISGIFKAQMRGKQRYRLE